MLQRLRFKPGLKERCNPLRQQQQQQRNHFIIEDRNLDRSDWPPITMALFILHPQSLVVEVVLPFQVDLPQVQLLRVWFEWLVMLKTGNMIIWAWILISNPRVNITHLHHLTATTLCDTFDNRFSMNNRWMLSIAVKLTLTLRIILNPSRFTTLNDQSPWTDWQNKQGGEAIRCIIITMWAGWT